MTLKAGEQVVEAVGLAYRAGTPVLLIGKHGIGKSELLEQAAKALGVDCIARDLSLMEPPDLVGLPYRDNGRTRYAPPAFLPTGGRGLLVFEELNRCERYMLAPCLQLLTARRLNDYALPEGWLPVAAINPADERYDVNELDPALLSRFSKIEVEACPKSFRQWAEASGVHPAVVRYTGDANDVFSSDESNPRSWTRVSDLLQAFEKGGYSESTLLALLSGQVGDAHARAFLRTYRDGTCEPLTLEDILAHPGKAQGIVRTWVADRRTDLLAATCHRIQVALQSSDRCAELLGNPSKKKGLRGFCQDLPADLSRQVKSFLLDQGVVL